MTDHSLNQTRRELRFWLCVVFAMALLSNAACLAIYGAPRISSAASVEGVRGWFANLGLFFGMAALVAELAGFSQATIRARVVCFLLGAAGYAYIVFVERSASKDPVANALILLAPLGCLHFANFLGELVKEKFDFRKCSDRNIVYVQLCFLVVLLGLATSTALDATKALLPATYDYHVYRIDAAYGGFANWCARIFDLGAPLLQTVTLVGYGLLVLVFYVVLGLTLREGRWQQLNVMRTFVVPFILASLFYSLVPVSGPIYAFFDGSFPHALPLITEVPAAKVVLPPFFRNGMPSFHLTGAILVWMLSAALTRKIAFYFSAIMVLCVAWATMALGEHYALDLIVALPFAMSLGWLLINPSNVVRTDRRIRVLVISGVITFAAWMIGLAFEPTWMSQHLGFIQIASVWSVLLSIVLAIIYLKQVWHLSPTCTNDECIRKVGISGQKTPAWIVGIFIASGFAGLVYEVVYAKALALTFGSTSIAAYTVLTVYMGGMALGAWLGGAVAENCKRPLYVYAVCELIIGLYAALTPQLFGLIQWLYVQISTDVPVGDPALSWLRVSLGAVVLLLPTVLMGATLPLMFKHLRTMGVGSRSAISHLYSANLVGAALGSLAAGYIVLPALGRDGSTYVAAVLSLIIALYAIERLKRQGNAVGEVLHADSDEVNATLSAQPLGAKFAGLSAVVVLGVGGGVTLALEVVSMHMLSTIAGSSVYAFGLMLATFLAGLGLGSVVGERFFTNWSRRQVVLFAQSGLVVSIGLTGHYWDSLPGYFGSFGMAQTHLSFGGRELVRAVVCAVAMMPGAFFIGMSYSPAIGLASEWIAPNSLVRGVGVASSINTLGNISGVLVAGFWVLPTLGSRLTLFVLASVAMVLALLFVFANLGTSVRARLIWRNPGIYACSLGALALCAFPSDWNWRELSSGSNVYFSAQDWGEVIEHAESVEGGITSVTRNSSGVFTLLTNGKFQGNNSQGGEMQAQASFALLPLLHTDRRDSALVIGYGTGMTARVLHEQGFSNLHVVELSSDLVRLADKYFSDINGLVSRESNVSLHIADGRNFLLTQSGKYDLISIELTSIWFAGAANLYNKDFYQLAKTRMKQGAVLQQWVQMHHMRSVDLLYILGSLRSVFDSVWVYYSGGQGVIVASDGDRDVDNKSARAALDASLRSSRYEFNSVSLSERIVAGPSRVDALLKGIDPSLQLLVSTDNNLFLEYSTPKGNAVYADTVSDNLRLLTGFAVKR